MRRISRYCEICGVTHFPLGVYEAWIAEYAPRAKVFVSSGKKNLAAQQLDRWRSIVDHHAQQGGAGVEKENLRATRGQARKRGRPRKVQSAG